MTAAMNYFQTMFMFKNFAPVKTSEQEIKLAIDLKAEAQNFSEIAAQEVKNGNTARDLALTATDENKVRAFTEIAIWHINRAAEKYRRAAARFEEAGKVYTKKSRAFDARAKEAAQSAAEAEIEIDFLTESLKRN